MKIEIPVASGRVPIFGTDKPARRPGPKQHAPSPVQSPVKPRQQQPPRQRRRRAA